MELYVIIVAYWDGANVVISPGGSAPDEEHLNELIARTNEYVNKRWKNWEFCIVTYDEIVNNQHFDRIKQMKQQILNRAEKVIEADMEIYHYQE